jgi:CPA2 family monovalent cation:H+ antiporter-2
MERMLIDVLLLLGGAVVLILVFQRLRVPSAFAYLVVGVAFGPYTGGPVIDSQNIQTVAEFGIVFLLFAIGLNFALPQLHGLRNQVLLLGTGQVLLTALVVGVLAWLLGAPPGAAFVIGAVFAQSSTTVIGKQLAEQAEDSSRHGRLGLALSVFQDITAVPFLVVIPAIGAAAGAAALGGELAWAAAKGTLAFVLVFGAGRYLLRPLFTLVAERSSAELFTLTVLFVSLLAAWTTSRLGLSMAFGAFLAGMVLGETEFRHQVEATIVRFRDVLVGLFFVGIGMLVDPAAIVSTWHWALFGAALLMASKTFLTAVLVRWSGIDWLTAWRTALILAVGGEFGFALLALALPTGAIDAQLAQVALLSVLFSIIAGPLLIRHNHAVAHLLAGHLPPPTADFQRPTVETRESLRDHVIICGYGRIGQSVAHLLDAEHIAYVALDLDAARVSAARLAGEPVFYGDGADADTLAAVGVETARLVVVSYADVPATRKLLAVVQGRRKDLAVMVRTRDETHVEELVRAGAAEAVPETLEASVVIAAQALLLLGVPLSRVARRMQEQRASRYRLFRALVPGDELAQSEDPSNVERVHPVLLAETSPAVGRTLAEIGLESVVVTALVREGARMLSPPPHTLLQADDAVVLFGYPSDLRRAERSLLG